MNAKRFYSDDRTPLDYMTPLIETIFKLLDDDDNPCFAYGEDAFDMLVEAGADVNADVNHALRVGHIWRIGYCYQKVNRRWS